MVAWAWILKGSCKSPHVFLASSENRGFSELEWKFTKFSMVSHIRYCTDLCVQWKERASGWCPILSGTQQLWRILGFPREKVQKLISQIAKRQKAENTKKYQEADISHRQRGKHCTQLINESYSSGQFGRYAICNISKSWTVSIGHR